MGVVVGGEGHMVRFSRIFVKSALSRFGGSFSLRELDVFFFMGNPPLHLGTAAVPKKFLMGMNGRVLLRPSRTSTGQLVLLSARISGKVPHKHQIQIKSRLQNQLLHVTTQIRPSSSWRGPKTSNVTSTRCFTSSGPGAASNRSFSRR